MPPLSSADREGYKTGLVNHLLHLFDSDESLGETVASFLIEGYRAGEHLMIVAKPKHCDAALAALRREGCFPPDITGTQRLVVLDASDLRAQISRNGAIDPVRFRKAVPPIVHSLAATGRVRVYGETVELLAEEGDLADALLLERLWHDLAAAIPISLLCGYSSAHFITDGGRLALRHICETHTCSLATDEDPLGRYLLALA